MLYLPLHSARMSKCRFLWSLLAYKHSQWILLSHQCGLIRSLCQMVWGKREKENLWGQILANEKVLCWNFKLPAGSGTGSSPQGEQWHWQCHYCSRSWVGSDWCQWLPAPACTQTREQIAVVTLVLVADEGRQCLPTLMCWTHPRYAVNLISDCS